MRLDHVELFVPDRDRAAQWYGRVLGFEILEQYRGWATEGGPLLISNDGGETKLALFVGLSQGEEAVRGLRRLAFRVSAEEFLRFVERSGVWRETPLPASDIQDHGKALSVYFSDPWGNLLEVTTYEPEAVREVL
ncbi:MAG: VOC family protein [Thermoanaerobaculia bacterium]|nr:VOC family protein [Thermoanaerobaculia bacterium]